MCIIMAKYSTQPQLLPSMASSFPHQSASSPSPIFLSQLSCLLSRYQVPRTESHTRILKPIINRKALCMEQLGSRFWTVPCKGLVWAKQAGREKLILTSSPGAYSTRLDFRGNTRGWSSENVFWSYSAWFESCICFLLTV